MGREYPQPFSMKDLFIDVKLEAYVKGTTFDFLGRKLFSTQFLREGIGFGITNIEIEVNTSLQPIVTVTMKDMYGLTVFGGQSRNDDYDNQSYDYSVLFDWPPPKFLFSFKGYLGKPVSWLLNLKRTTTNFNSSDGSYEIKCEFVPNQWGFFADLPMLFLLAAKAMRRDRVGNSPANPAYVTSVFDLIKIGKQVEVKTKDTTKEFDELIKQLGSLKSNIAGTLVSSKVVGFGDEITGVVNNIPIKGFKKITIPKLEDFDSSVNTEEKVNLKISDPTSLSKVNTYMLLHLKIDGKYYHNFSIPSYSSLQPNESNTSIAKNQTIEGINKNIRLIEDEIKRRVYNSSKSKLKKITIGEIFSQLAKDAAFIIGNIIESGLKGYNNNVDSRSQNEKNLIGQSFPLMIKDNGEEVPATTENFGDDLGVDKYEMDFVRKFINAISEGIAKDLIDDNDSNLSDDSTLKNRINNMEIIKGNPYKPFYRDIATNILVRGGIAGFVTRSNDPNKPGDYANDFVDFYFDREGADDLIALAELDSKNITDGILSQMSDVDILSLKRFCKFFGRFYQENGEYLIERDKDGNTSKGAEITSADQASTYKVIMEDSPEVTLTFEQLFKELKKGNIDFSSNKTGGLVLPAEELEEDSEFSTSQVPSSIDPIQFIDDEEYTAKKIINNGIAYTKPLNNSDRYWYVVFEGNDNVKAQEANSSPSDSESKGSERDESQDEPVGYLPINAVKDSEQKELGYYKLFNDRQSQFLLVSYDKLKNPESSFYDKDESSGFQNYLFTKKIYESKEEAIYEGKKPGEYAIAGEIGMTVFSNFDGDTFGEDGLVFDMFSNTRQSISQRVFIKHICKLILQNINKLEEERNQVIGSVLGKAAEQEVALYKQMHTLFHQWEVLSYASNKKSDSQKVDGLIDELEEKYGGSHNDITSSEDVNGLPDGAFVYEFPLQRINGVKGGKPIQVRNSLINLEPLYKLNGDTSVLNIIQQICTKNNFLFIPIPGNASYMNVSDLYSPSQMHASIDVRNFFHVLFTPTPESRAKTKNNGAPLALSENHKNYDTNSFAIKYGHPDNQIVSNIQVGTDDNKVTAESIVNLQRLADNENQNKVVTTDCSTLPVLEGRSYKATIDMIGNAQVYPMQFFFLENSPLFGGLYQVMDVKHSITPNDMKTSVGGMRMRFVDSGYGSIKPVTLETLEGLGKLEEPVAFSKDEKEKIREINDSTSTTGFMNNKSTKLSKSAAKIIKKSSTEEDATEAIIKFLEGGYFHPAHAWDSKKNKIKRGYTIMRNSSETLFGIDRKKGEWIKSSKGRAFWEKIDTISGYGSYSDTNWLKTTRQWDIKNKPLKNSAWGYNHFPDKSEISSLLTEAKNMIKERFDKYIKLNFSNHPLKKIILEDGRLIFMFYRATWNGSGFFAKYASNIKRVYDSGERNVDKLIEADLDYRYKTKKGEFKQGVIDMKYMIDYNP